MTMDRWVSDAPERCLGNLLLHEQYIKDKAFYVLTLPLAENIRLIVAQNIFNQ